MLFHTIASLPNMVRQVNANKNAYEVTPKCPLEIGVAAWTVATECMCITGRTKRRRGGGGVQRPVNRTGSTQDERAGRDDF